MVKSTKTLIKTMTDKNLLYYAARFRKESADPATYGSGGTTRWVTATDFWGKSGKAEIMREIERRKRAGKISATAGVQREVKKDMFGNPIRKSNNSWGGW